MTAIPGASPLLLAPTGGGAVVGVIGWPVAHSLSPAMHNSAFRALGLDWIYVPFPVAPEWVPEAVAGLKALGMRGANVTIPYKEAVMPLLDEVTERARRAGAVNTIVCEDGRLSGDNTDGIGFVRSLREEADFDPEGARVFIYGSGGSAKAIATALAEAGAEYVAVANRTAARATELAEAVAALGVRCDGFGLDAPGLGAVVKGSDLLVQTTPAGMAGGPLEGKLPAGLQPDRLREGLVVADIVYTPLETPLVQAARLRGCTVAPGWGMLLYQGAEAFSRWTGRPAPVAVMRSALLQALRGPEAEAKG